jgi:hypothetical protein
MCFQEEESMTLIAGYIINSCPVLLGDVLVSNPKGKGESISTPTWHEAEEAQQGPLQIVRMVQKVNIVHDHACFAWAGSYLQARVFATALRAHLEVNDLDEAKMNEFFKSFDKSDYDDFVCIIYTLDKGILKRYHLNADEYPLDGVMVQTGGTGQGHFIEAVEYFFKPAEEGDTRAETVIAPGLSYIASALGEQIFTGWGLGEGWGGAFELAYYSHGKFHKIDDVLYVFWTGKEGTNSLDYFPYLVKTNYFGDTFVVKVIDNSIEAPQTRIYNISPLGMKDEAQHNPPMTFTYLINYIMIEKKDGQKVACVIQMTKNDAEGFSIKKENGSTSLELSRKFANRLLEGAFGAGVTLEKN